MLTGFLVLALVLSACEKNVSYQYRWDLFFRSVFTPSPLILAGLGLTVAIAVVSQAVGVILGILGALGRLSSAAPIRWLAAFYVWIFRGTPLLVQITFVYFGLGVAGIYAWDRHPLLGIPGAIQAGTVALALNEGAYMTAICASSVFHDESVSPDQTQPPHCAMPG